MDSRAGSSTLVGEWQEISRVSAWESTSDTDTLFPYTTLFRSQVKRGVPQGSVLGPLLFLIHISDINYKIADSTVSCFADDTRILLGIKDEEDTQILQNYLRKLYKWADKKNMNSMLQIWTSEIWKRRGNKICNNLQIRWLFKHQRQRTSQRSRHQDE